MKAIECTEGKATAKKVCELSKNNYGARLSLKCLHCSVRFVVKHGQLQENYESLECGDKQVDVVEELNRR